MISKLPIKSGIQIDSFYTSLYMDMDIGCTFDNYVGYIPEEGLTFAYNADPIDGEPDCTCIPYITTSYCEEIPIFGVKQLEAYRNSQVQIIEPSAFVPFQDEPVIIPPPCLAYHPPTFPKDYHRFMRGLLNCDLPITEGGEGVFNDGDTTTFAFPDNPADPDGWSMCNTDWVGGVDNTTLSFGPMRFEYQDQIHLSFALIFVPNVPHPCPDITPLIEAGNKAQKLFDDISTSTQEEIRIKSHVKVFPNPMSELANLELSSKGDQLQALRLFNSSGMLVRKENQLSGSIYSIEKANLPVGIYFFKLYTQKGNQLSGRIIIQ